MNSLILKITLTILLSICLKCQGKYHYRDYFEYLKKLTDNNNNNTVEGNNNTIKIHECLIVNVELNDNNNITVHGIKNTIDNINNNNNNNNNNNTVDGITRKFKIDINVNSLRIINN
jgi:hypothetical protein